MIGLEHPSLLLLAGVIGVLVVFLWASVRFAEPLMAAHRPLWVRVAVGAVTMVVAALCWLFAVGVLVGPYVWQSHRLTDSGSSEVSGPALPADSKFEVLAVDYIKRVEDYQGSGSNGYYVKLITARLVDDVAFISDADIVWLGPQEQPRVEAKWVEPNADFLLGHWDKAVLYLPTTKQPFFKGNKGSEGA